MKKGPVLILGGSSDIGLAIAHHFAAEGHPIQLAARDPRQLAREVSDIELRYRVPVTLYTFDAVAPRTRSALTDGFGVLPDVAVCVVGLLGDQGEGERDLEAAERVMVTNYLGPAWLMGDLANRFEARGSGTLVGISSVAGDRGRATNYVYGSAKAGFTAFLSGLRNRLASKGVHVITVKPGFVNTRMTEAIELPRLLTSSPEMVARAVGKALKLKRDVVYIVPLWRLIMLAIRLIPERLFKRMSL